VVYAERAHIGGASASAGATIFAGETVSTDQTGGFQLRAGAARFMLAGSSTATVNTSNGIPSAVLTGGTATFSTANAKAFELHVSNAVIRPERDIPTVGQVTVLNAKELVVRSTKGSLTITVEDDSRVIAEGMAYRIVLDPVPPYLAAGSANPQDPQGYGTRGYGRNTPRVAGKSKFTWYVIAFVAVATWIALDEVFESPYRVR
jgi:hypothetical protein